MVVVVIDDPDLVDRMCSGKKQRTAKGARARAEQARNAGHQLSPYRCPVCGWWHVGHAPSMKAVEAIARAIRGLPDARPAPVEQTDGHG